MKIDSGYIQVRGYGRSNSLVGLAAPSLQGFPIDRVTFPAGVIGRDTS